MPRVPISIALGVYNGANFLREALESVLAQGDAFDELVVSDNCSADETPAILAEFAARDSRVKVSRSETFLNQADNINRAVQLCRNEWVQMFCHDDVFLPGAIARLAEVVGRHDRPSLALVAHQPFNFFADGHCYRTLRGVGVVEKVSDVLSSVVSAPLAPPDCHVGETCLRESLAGGSLPYVPAVTTAAVRRSVFFELGGFSSRWVHFDVFLWLRLLQKKDYLVLNEHLTLTRVHRQQVAVVSRRNLRSYHDSKGFYPAFADELRARYGLNLATCWKIRLKPISTASDLLVFFMHKKDLGGFVKAYATLPWHLWIPIVPFAIRNYFIQNCRHRNLWAVVPKSITLE